MPVKWDPRQRQPRHLANERVAASCLGGLGGATLRGLGITTGVGLLTIEDYGSMTMEDCGCCGVYVDYDDEIMNIMSMMMS